MSRLHDLLRRHTANEPRREQEARKLRLRVPRRHIHNQTLEGSICNTLKLVSYNLVVPTSYKAGPHKFYKVDEAVMRPLLLSYLNRTVQKLRILLRNLLREKFNG